ncbi:MAG: DNA polymerase IV [Acidobacteriota bacterium]
METPPIRRILHCDMDCFYAAVHVRDDPSLAGLPVAIGGNPSGRGVVAAASYEIRRFGVRSAMPAARAVRLCPQAVFIRPDFPRYRAESQQVFEILRQFTPLVQAVSIDEAFLDVTDHLEPWGSATAVAKEIRRRVAEERRLTVSVGVGPNKLVAKIASDHDKPDGLTVVRPERVAEFLGPLAARRLHGVGPATERSLKQLGVETIADLRALSKDLLGARFGRWGEALWRFSRGIDHRPVTTHRERKSLSSENTYAQDLETLEQMDAEIGRLAAQVAKGLAKRELLAATVTLKVRYQDFSTVTRSRTLGLPTADEEVIRWHATDLLRRTEAAQRPVRLLGVGASKLAAGDPSQLSLFDG